MSPYLQVLNKIPATLTLIALNIFAFAVCILQDGSVQGPAWALTLLRLGAQFNPFTLDQEWHRIFTHMFLHGGILHMGVNMFALFSVGREIENLTGTRKFLLIYFVAGVAAALASLYWNLFEIGVGASGAIFGLFGFSLVSTLFLNRGDGRSITPVLINFAVFVGVNLMIAKAINADNAAHFGGLVAGILMGTLGVFAGSTNPFREMKTALLIIPLLIVTYFALPRFQVTYYKFFQQVVAAEDSTTQRLEHALTDEQYLVVLTTTIDQWDSVMGMLNSQRYLPEELASDTFKLRKYVGLRKQENIFRKKMIEKQSFIYLDSVGHVQRLMQQYIGLRYNLKYGLSEERPKSPDSTEREMVQVWYDADWVEVPGPPGTYYRIGTKDSLGRWDGFVQDFYQNGDIQMKGAYRQDKRDGIFLYYSDHQTYTSAGRYHDDESVGKWEFFHNNGDLASEVYYDEGYFLKNLWDSLGNHLVIDGEGTEIQYHPNGVVALEGRYRKGKREDYWYGNHPNGELHFEELFEEGRLVSGRSRNSDGHSFTYDASSLFVLPEVGAEKFNDYLKDATRKIHSEAKGEVWLSFRVTEKKRLADLKVEKSLSPELDERAKEILLTGPKWRPATLHGYQAVEAFGRVVVAFNSEQAP